MDPAFSAVVTNIHAAWTEAFARRDVARLEALYTPDAAFYGSAPQLYRGREGVRRYFTQLPTRFKRARFADAAVVVLAPTAIAASGLVEFASEQDGVHATLPYRMTQVLTQQSGTWRNVADRDPSRLPRAVAVGCPIRRGQRSTCRPASIAAVFTKPGRKAHAGYHEP